MTNQFRILAATVLLLTGCGRPSGTDEKTEITPAPMEVLVDGSGYTPSEVQGQAGKELRLSFKRMTDEGCGEKVVFPDLGVEKALPLGIPVEVAVTPRKSAPIAFTCGMNMYRGSVVAQ